MLIDWFTVVAQTLNFLVLIWLMQRYLYRPVLDAIDARAVRAVAELQAARVAQLAATDERNALIARERAFDAERDALATVARSEAMALREAMLATARAEADTFRASRASALAREAAEQEAELDTRVRNAVFGMTRKVLGEMADATLETQLVAKFARELTALPETTQETLRSTFVATGASERRVVVVRSAFALEPTQRDIICNSVITLLGEQPEIDFRVDPSLVVGIELDVADHTVGWSMSGYVKSLERAVADRPVSDA